MNLVCLVSRQPMANVFPILMYKPENVFLLSTQEELLCAKHLQSLFVRKGSKVFLYDDISAYDQLTLNKRLLSISNNYGVDLFLNITGGTKLMAITAYEFFREINKPVFYCDTEHKDIIHLLPIRKNEKLKALLTIKDYFSAYGYTIEDEKPASLNFPYAEFFVLIEKENILDEFILFTKSVRERFTESFNKTLHSKNKNFSFQKTTGKFILLINKVKSPIKLVFETKSFLFGDWLEYYVFWKLSPFKPDEIKIGVKIISENNIQNEIDLVILKNYKLILVSCKSGILNAKTENTQLYELETLRLITSGPFGKGVAVLSNKPSPTFVKRAEELKIMLIDDLKNVHEMIC